MLETALAILVLATRCLYTPSTETNSPTTSLPIRHFLSLCAEAVLGTP
jgi:hypothetical protein